MNFCVFTLAVRQRFSSIVCPVSVSFEVKEQRTSKLLIWGSVFGFGRRGGSKRNLVAMSESINDASFGGVVGRHLHFHPVADCKANESLAHPSRDVCENKMVIRECDAKHRSGKHRLDGTLNFNGLFRIHHVDLGDVANGAAPKAFGAGCAINSGSTDDCLRTNASRRKDADALRADALR